MVALIPIPGGISGWCAWRVLQRLADQTSDIDDKPDALTVTGTVKISPVKKVDYISNPSASGVNQDVTAVINPDTGLMELADRPGEGGFYLWAGTYQVTAATQPGGIDTFRVVVAGGETPTTPCDFAVQREQQITNPTVQLVSTPLPLGGTDGPVLTRSGAGTAWADQTGGTGGAVASVNGQTGAVTLDAAAVGALPSTYTPPAAPVQSVAGKTGAVTLATGDVAGFAAAAAAAAPVQTVAGKSGSVTLAKADVGLGNVDNTSDAAKPISTATQTALNGKAGTSTAGLTIDSGPTLPAAGTPGRIFVVTP